MKSILKNLFLPIGLFISGVIAFLFWWLIVGIFCVLVATCLIVIIVKFIVDLARIFFQPDK